MIAASGSSEAVSSAWPPGPASWLEGEARAGTEAACTGMVAVLVLTVWPTLWPEPPDPFPPTSIFI